MTTSKAITDDAQRRVAPKDQIHTRTEVDSRQLNIVALVTDAFGGKGGIAQCSRNFLTALSESDKIGSLVAVVRNPPAYQETLPNKLRICHPNANNKLMYAVRAVKEARNGGKPDVVICGHLNLLPVAWLVGKLSNAPIVLYIHGIEAWTPPNQFLVTRLLAEVDIIVSVSHYTKDRFLQWHPGSRAKIKTLNNCIKLEGYGVQPDSRKLRERYRIGAGPVLMTIARLDAAERYKGIDEVLEALLAVKNDVPELVYLIVGEGDDQARLERKAETLGLRDSVIFTGWVADSEKQDHLSIADVFVMPGWGEGFGIVYLEAMACGVPVIASELDGSREAVLNGVLGEVVNPHDQAAIQAAILRCLRKKKQVPQGLAQFDYGVFKNRLIYIILEAKQLHPHNQNKDATRHNPLDLRS